MRECYDSECDHPKTFGHHLITPIFPGQIKIHEIRIEKQVLDVIDLSYINDCMYARARRYLLMNHSIEI